MLFGKLDPNYGGGFCQGFPSRGLKHQQNFESKLKNGHFFGKITSFNLNPKTPNPDRFDKSNFHAENDFGIGAALFGGPNDLLARFENFPYFPLGTCFKSLINYSILAMPD